LQKVRQLPLVLCLLGLAACNSHSSSETLAKKDSAAVSASTTSDIVYVNSDTLLANYEMAKQIRQEFETRRLSAENDLGAKGRSLENEVIDYQRRGRDMSLEQAQSTEQRLGKKQQELMRYRDEVSRKLVEEEQKRTEELYNRVADFLKRYSQEKKYKFVLTYQKGNDRVLYAEPSLDITQEVLVRLNEEFKAKKDSVK
jgi:outer membrane protein